MSDQSHDEASAAWDLLVEGLLLTDFGREVDTAGLLARAGRRARSRERHLVLALWAAVLLLSLGAALLGADLGNQTALQRDQLGRISLSHSAQTPEMARPTGDRP